uniref:Uncharacterized protein n=1 Tax=Arundo donax TaxID=35708 RepID=A0A0A8ZGF7_ARUDO
MFGFPVYMYGLGFLFIGLGYFSCDHSPSKTQDVFTLVDHFQTSLFLPITLNQEFRMKQHVWMQVDNLVCSFVWIH